MSKVTDVLIRMVLTPCFVLPVRFALVLLKFNFVWPHQGMISLSFKKTTVHINLLEINNAKSTLLALSSGEERGLPSRTAAVNRAYVE